MNFFSADAMGDSLKRCDWTALTGTRVIRFEAGSARRTLAGDSGRQLSALCQSLCGRAQTRSAESRR